MDFRDTLRAIKYRIQPKFKFVIDASPDYELTIKTATRSKQNMPATYELRGWALHPEELTQLQWYCQDECLCTVRTWQSRADVADAFPFIPHADSSGFTFWIPAAVLHSAPAKMLQLRAHIGGASHILWQNTATVEPDLSTFDAAISDWREQLGRESVTRERDSIKKVEASVPIILRSNTETDIPVSIRSILDQLTCPDEPLCIPTDMLGVVEIASEPADNQSRPIIIESAELLEQAYVLRYLIGGSVHLLVDDFHTAPASRAICWSSDGSIRKDPAPLPTRAIGLTVIVPVYNALHVSRRCIETVIPALDESDECLIVSDASDRHVNESLSEIAEKHERIRFIHRKVNGGFVEACWTGYEAAASGNDILLLNSDTVIAPSTLARLKSQMYERPEIAMGSPLSTGSPNFEIPLAPGENFFQAAERLHSLNVCTTPTAITPEGQCLYIKRWALSSFGFIDKIYGRGFCEESDLAMRVFLRGGDTVCLDRALIYHERSATFGSYQRQKQLQRNRPIFEARWGRSYDLAYAAFKRRNPLGPLREAWFQHAPSDPLSNIDIAYVIPTLVTAGGHLSVIQHVNSMILKHKRAGIICFRRRQVAETALPLLTEPVFIEEEAFRQRRSLPRHVIATMWTSARSVQQVTRQSEATGWYYVQDYEPWFYERSDQHSERTQAEQSYELGLSMVAKTEFLCSLIEKRHGRPVRKVCPGIARDIFYPGEQTQHRGAPRLAALYRPDKPRRGTDLLLQVLEELLNRNNSISIYLFGSSDLTPCSPALRRKIHFLGALTSGQVADLYRNSDIVCDFSLWHGFGRMGIEAMACGAVPVLTEAGGIQEYARHNENALIVPDDPAKIADTVNHVLFNDVLRHGLRQSGLQSFVWSEQQATSDWLQLLEHSDDTSRAA